MVKLNNMASLDSRRSVNGLIGNTVLLRRLNPMKSCIRRWLQMQASWRVKRASPLFSLLNEKGAIHNVVAGYEKPLWFKTKERQSEQLTWMRSDA